MVKHKHQLKIPNQLIDRTNANPFSLNGTKILYMLFAEYKLLKEFKPGNNPLKTSKTINEIKELFPLLAKDKNILTRIRKINKELLTTMCGAARNISDSDYLMIGPPLMSASMKDGTLTAKINPELLPYLDSEKNYTLPYVESIAQLTTSNSINLHQILERYAKIQNKKYLIKDLKEQLGLNRKYKQIRSFIRESIKPTIVEINKHSNLYVSYTLNKTGRAITDIDFVISYKNKLQNTKSTKSQELTNKLLKIGLEPKVIDSLSKYHNNALNEACDLIIKRKPQNHIKNPRDYFFKTLDTVMKKNKITNQKTFLVFNYLKSLSPEQSNKQWDEFINQANQATKEQVEAYRNSKSDAIKESLKNSIKKSHYQWVYKNKITNKDNKK